MENMIDFDKLTADELEAFLEKAHRAKEKRVAEEQWPVKKVIYFHRTQDDNRELEEFFKTRTGKTEFFDDNIKFVGYEVGLDVLIDREGSARVTGINGTKIYTQGGHPHEMRI